jgi:flavorubredoxin
MVTWDTQRIHESLCAQAALGAQIIAPGHGQVLRGAHHLRALCG